MADHIVLTTDTLSKRFKLIQPFKPAWDKAAKMRRTVAGVDFEMGKLYEIHRLTFRVRHTETNSDYGSLADLKAIWGTNAVLMYTDLWGEQHRAVFVDNASPIPLSVVVEGECAYFIVQATLVLLD